MKQKMRKFHLRDFPIDRLRIRLESKFRKKFFKKTKKEIGYKVLKEKFGILPKRVSVWNLEQAYMPLNKIFEISRFLEKKGFKKFGEIQLEKKITSLKSWHGNNKYAIIQPNLPLKQNEQLVRIIAHLIGDGYGGYYDKKTNSVKRANYCNKNRRVFNNFIKCLSVFGRVRCYIWKKNVAFLPTAIIYIINHIYGIDFHYDKSEIPRLILKTDKKLLRHLLAAFIDDEGTITTSASRIMLANKRLVIQLMLLFKRLNFETSEVKCSYGKYWYFSVRDITKIKELPIIHSEKLKVINFSLGRSMKRHANMEIKNQILTLLKRKPVNSNYLAWKFDIHPQTIRRHLRELRKGNNIEFIRGNENKYRLQKEE